jgi:hypothetical protein
MRLGRGSFVARLFYWSPVLVCMVLFAQVSFLGLRPALCERRRLAESQAVLEARHARDLSLRDQATLSLRVRADPIFLERQRRSRWIGAVAGTGTAAMRPAPPAGE